MNERVSSSKERIVELMKMYEISQNEFVRRTGLNKSTVSYYVSGKRIPHQDQIFIIAKTFNVEPAWLMGYDVPMRKTPMEIGQLLADVTLDKRLQDNVQMLLQLSSDKQDFIYNQIEYLYKQQLKQTN